MAVGLEYLMKIFTYSEIRVDLIIMDVVGHVFDLRIEFPATGHRGGIRPQGGHGGKGASRRGDRM